MRNKKLAVDKDGFIQGTNFTSNDLDLIQVVLFARSIIGINGLNPPSEYWMKAFCNTTDDIHEWAYNQIE